MVENTLALSKALLGALRCHLWDSTGLGERSKGTQRHKKLDGYSRAGAAAGFGSMFSLQSSQYFHYTFSKSFDRPEVYSFI